MTNEPIIQESEMVETPTETSIEIAQDPIYKHKDGRIITKSMLLKDGLDDTRIKSGLDKGLITQIGDTEDPTQEFKHKDGRVISVKQMLDDGITIDRISNGIELGMITPLEKKNQVVTETTSESLPGGVSDSTTNIPIVSLDKEETPPQQPLIAEPTDIISKVLKIQELKKKGTDVAIPVAGGNLPSTFVPDEASQKQAESIKSELNAQKINADDLYNQIKDLPEEFYNTTLTKEDGTIEKPYTKENLSQMYVEEPIKFRNTLDQWKNRLALKKAANELTEQGQPTDAIALSEQYNNLNEAPSFEQWKENKQEQQNMINTYISNMDDRKKALSRLEEVSASFITPDNLDLIKEYEQSPLKNKLDVSQYAALETMRLFHPDKYEQAINFISAPTETEYTKTGNISFGKDGFSIEPTSKESEESINRKLGKEAILKRLSDEGRYNAIVDLERKNEKLVAASAKVTDQSQLDSIKQQYEDNNAKIQAIKEDYKKDDERYPLTATNKYDQQIKDITQQAGFNAAEYATSKFALGFVKTGRSLENILVSVFGNNQDKVLHDLARFGTYQQEQADFYLPNKYNKDNPIVGMQVDKPLQDAMQKILKGKNISDLSVDEKEKLQNLLSQNQNQIHTITNTDKEGKGANYTASSVLYSNAGMIGDILSFGMQAGLLGGFGVSGEIASAVSMFTTAQDDFRNEAIANGNPDPDGYANVMASVIGLAGLISPNLNIVKRAVGAETKVGQMIAGVSEKTWNTVIEKNKPIIDKIYNSVSHVGKEAVSMGLTYGAGVPIAQGVIGKEMYNQPLTYDQIFENALQSTEHLLVSSVGLFGLGAVTNFKSTTLDQKANLWQASSNKLLTLIKIDEAVKDKLITPEQAVERKKVIEEASKIINDMPTRTTSGEQMTDKQRLNYFYNLLIQNEAKKQKSVLPKAQQEKLDYTTMVADHLNDLIIDPKTPEELNTRKKELEAFLTPQKDKEGKEIVLSEKDKLQAQSELEAINTHLEDKIKEQQPVPNAEEIITGKPAKLVEIKEQIVEPISDITVSEMLDKTGKYKGEEGSFYQDGQTVVFKVAGKNKEYELGNIEEIGDSPIKDFDIEHKESVVTIGENGELIVRGEEYKNRYSDPLMAIDRDANGNVIGVTLETKNGNKRRFRGNTAEDIAYQIHLQEINKNNETAEFEEFINEPEQQQQIGDATISIATPEVTIESTEPIQREKIEPIQTEVEKLRTEEQAELDSRIPNAEQYRVDGKVDRTKLINEEDIKAFDEVYDKYDKLITPLLKETEATTPSVESPKVEFKEPKDDTERKSVADRLRSAKIKSDKLFDATIGLPVAVWNGAVELVATSIEAGMLIADALKRGINYIEKNHRGKWDKKAYNDKVIEQLGYKGININGEDVIAKPIVDKQSAEMINGFYSPLEQGILDTKGDKFTGKEWAKKLEGTTEGDELKFTGMTDFLSENADKSLTKQEVLDYMKNNRIEINEIQQGTETDNWEQIGDEYYNKKDDGEADEKYKIVYDKEDEEYSVYRGKEHIRSRPTLEKAKEAAEESALQSQGLDLSGGATKYSEYQLPGESSNYKELLITLPLKEKQNPRKELGGNPEIITDSKIAEQTNGEELEAGEEMYYYPSGLYIKKLSSGKFYTIVGNRDEVFNTLPAAELWLVNHADEVTDLVTTENRFQSSHFDEPNILAHVRMNTRVDAKGNKVLHIEEFQSDWGQQGKKRGFKGEKLPKGEKFREQIEQFEKAPVKDIYINGDYVFYTDKNGEIIAAQIEGNKLRLEEAGPIDPRGVDAETYQQNILASQGSTGVPEAPFVTETANWVKLAWKMAVKEAVKEGAEKITWTTGEQQNERYDLSKQVDNIHVEAVENEKGVHLVDIELAYGGKEYLEVENGIIREGKYEGKTLDDVIGKEYAEKVLSIPEGQTKVLRGEDLKLGGTGMKGFYGSPSEGKLGIVGEVAKALFKQEPTTVNLKGEKPITIENTRVEKGTTSYVLMNENGDSLATMSFETGDNFSKKDLHIELVDLAKRFAQKELQETTQHSIEITPEIKAAVKEGMPLFKSPYQKIADFLRGGKLDKDIAMAGIPFLKEVWNGALEIAAITAEVTGDSVKAIKAAIQHIKSTDWYKSLSTSDKEKMINHFVDEHLDLLPKGKASLNLTVETDHPYLYRGSTEKRVSGLMSHLMESENVSNETKEDLRRNGIDYAIANNEEARKVAAEIVDAFGEDDALKIAEQNDMHASVRSAIFAETIDRAYNREKNATTDAEKIEAAEQWKDRVNTYDKLLTAGGQFTAYVNHFYGTSPLGFVMRENENTNQRFNDWYKDKQPTYQELLDALNETAEGKAYIAEEVERIVKEERKDRRAKRDKSIEDFFDKAKMQGGTYATVIPPNVWNGAMDALKAAVKAGDRVADAVQRAIETISAQIGNNWDKEKFRKEYEALLAKVADGDKKEPTKQDLASVYERRKRELERRITNKDFSAEEYKDKKTLSDKEKAAKEEYERVKKLYDEEKKKSPEWQDKKAKQFVDKFRERMKGLDDKQKEEVVRKSIKKLAETGALREDEFKKIVAEVIGFKDLSDAQVKQIEDLTRTINSLSDVEDAMVANPNEQTIAAYKKAKEDAIQAGLDLYNIIHKKSDITGTIKSWITGSLLSVPTLIKNIAQNVIMQGFIRFPREVVKQMGELGIYGTTYIGNKLLGTKMYEPTSNIFKAQKGYFKGYKEGLKRGWFNFKRGTQEQDYFGKTSYQSTLAPRQASRDLKMWRSGEKFLTKTEVVDRWLRANIFARQADFILRGMGFGDRPQRFAAERAKALQIASSELKLVDDASVIAFMESPQKMAYKTLIDAGVNKAEALSRSIEIEERIKQEGSKAVLDEENLLSMASTYIEKGLMPKKDAGVGMKSIQRGASIAKTLTFPFVKIPANVYWQMFKLFNPEVSIGQSLWHAREAYSYAKKGENAKARQSMEKSKDSMAMAALGYGISLAATTLISQGYIRSNPSSEDKAKVRAGEKLFGKGNQIDMGTLMGGSPYWVDLAWLGPIGAELDIKQRLHEDKIKAQLKGEKPASDFGEWWNGLEYSGAAALNQLVFDQGARTINAIRDGQNAGKVYLVNTINTFENMFTGATYVAISKAMLPEEPRLKGDSVIEELKNNAQQRNILYRLATSRPPSRISMWGDPIKKDTSLAGVMGNILGFEAEAPVQFGAVIYDDYKKTLDARFFPPIEDNKLTVDGKDVEITQAQKDELETLIGKYRKALVSPFISDCATTTFGVPVIEKDEEGNEIVKSKYLKYSEIEEPLVKDWAEQRILALNKLYSEGKKAGMDKFLEKHPEYSPKILNKMEEKMKAKEEAHVEKFGAQAEKKIRQINKKSQ